VLFVGGLQLSDAVVLELVVVGVVDELVVVGVGVELGVLVDVELGVLEDVELGAEPGVTVRVTGTEMPPPWAAVIVTVAV